MAEQEMSLDEAIALADRYTGTFRAFAKISQVLEAARLADGRLTNLATALAESETKLAEAVAAEKDAQASWEQVAHQLTAKREAEESLLASRLAELAVELDQARQEHAAALEAEGLKYQAAAQEIEDSLRKLQEREDLLTANVAMLEAKKQDLVAFFADVTKS